LLGPAGEADEVGEEDRDDLALFPGGRLLGLERRAALHAEARVVGVLVPTCPAANHALKRTL
jgi:hypothetical protein